MSAEVQPLHARDLAAADRELHLMQRIAELERQLKHARE